MRTITYLYLLWARVLRWWKKRDVACAIEMDCRQPLPLLIPVNELFGNPQPAQDFLFLSLSRVCVCVCLFLSPKPKGNLWPTHSFLLLRLVVFTIITPGIKTTSKRNEREKENSTYFFSARLFHRGPTFNGCFSQRTWLVCACVYVQVSSSPLLSSLNLVCKSPADQTWCPTIRKKKNNETIPSRGKPQDPSVIPQRSFC